MSQEPADQTRHESSEGSSTPQPVASPAAPKSAATGADGSASAGKVSPGREQSAQASIVDNIDAAPKDFSIYKTCVSYQRDEKDDTLVRATIVLSLRIKCEDTKDLRGFSLRLAVTEATHNSSVRLDGINPSEPQYAILNTTRTSHTTASTVHPVVSAVNIGSIEFFTRSKSSSWSDFKGQHVEFDVEPYSKEAKIRLLNHDNGPIPRQYLVLLTIEIARPTQVCVLVGQQKIPALQGRHDRMWCTIDKEFRAELVTSYASDELGLVRALRDWNITFRDTQPPTAETAVSPTQNGGVQKG
ncbi:hypothetical protein EHS25_003603 [Saitozyma podzolica]|uniref:Uncharacterized protein n=1 Tax=Saitozyma podzolica TaxID=1890683 RepID=A0A427Y7T7_9TREE|nr:hypothetical protein EHS25_003603 [Saitozyma podzolica]